VTRICLEPLEIHTVDFSVERARETKIDGHRELKSLRETGKEQQVPPLRFAPVGMTILLQGRTLFRCIYSGYYRIVIPTGAYPDFLLRAASSDHVCGSPQREPNALLQRHHSQQEIRGKRSGETCCFWCGQEASLV
jgi:hypothetical protein